MRGRSWRTPATTVGIAINQRSSGFSSENLLHKSHVIKCLLMKITNYARDDIRMKIARKLSVDDGTCSEMLFTAASIFSGNSFHSHHHSESTRAAKYIQTSQQCFNSFRFLAGIWLQFKFPLEAFSVTRLGHQTLNGIPLIYWHESSTIENSRQLQLCHCWHNRLQLKIEKKNSNLA